MKKIIVGLTIAGLIPFIFLTFTRQTNWLPINFIDRLLITYGALILSFLGGVQWGIGLSQSNKNLLNFSLFFLFSILPTLVAWIILAMSEIYYQLIGLILGFAGILITDLVLHSKKALPSWFLKLRLSISLVVIILLLTNIFLK